MFYCLLKVRHTDGPHEFQECSSQKCSRGGLGWVMQGGVGNVGVGWVMQGGWDGTCRGGVGWVMQGWGGVGHAGVGWIIHG